VRKKERQVGQKQDHAPGRCRTIGVTVRQKDEQQAERRGNQERVKAP
jgi:hypothetical protein